jgi:hypothetical protein
MFIVYDLRDITIQVANFPNLKKAIYEIDLNAGKILS